MFANVEAEDQRARLRAGAVTAAVDGLIERGKTGEARALIENGGFDAELEPKPARLLLGRIAKSERDNARNAARQAGKAKTVAVADLDFRVATGQAFPDELDSELDQGTISAAEYADFLAELKRFDVDGARRADGAARVTGKLANGEKPDAGDAAERAAVDELFDDLAEANAGRPPEEMAIIETRFVRRTAMLPTALSDSLTAGMLSEDPAAQVAAAGRFVVFEDADPALIINLPADILDRARTITAYAYPGLPPARIVKLAAEKMAQEAEAAQKAQKAEDEPPAEDIDDDEDGTPDLPGDEPGEREGGAPPVIDEIIEAPSRKPAVDPFQLTPKQKERARQTIAIVDNEGADKLTRKEKVAALKYLRRKPNLTSQERKTAITIFRSIPIDAAFAKDDAPKRRELMDRLSKDKTVVSSVKNWAKMDYGERLSALDQALTIYVSIYQIDRPNLQLKDMGGSGPQGRIAGSYNERTNTITLNRNAFVALPRLAPDSFAAIIHEAGHAYLLKLTNDYEDGKIDSADPRSRQILILALNRGPLLFSPKGMSNEYNDQPSEVYVQDVGKQVKISLEQFLR